MKQDKMLSRRVAVRLLAGTGAGIVAAATGLMPNRAMAETGVRRPRSYNELKFDTVVRQTADFTCGAASIATILTHYWGRPTTEIEVLEMIRLRYTAAEWKQREERGVSFDDLIFASGRLGYVADGAELPAERLQHLAAPVIVHLDKGSFQHFSVLRKATEDMAYLSDSIVGTTALTMPDFATQYTGKALAIARKGSGLVARSPLGAVRDGQSVSRVVGDEMVRGVERLHPGIR